MEQHQDDENCSARQEPSHLHALLRPSYLYTIHIHCLNKVTPVLLQLLQTCTNFEIILAEMLLRK